MPYNRKSLSVLTPPGPSRSGHGPEEFQQHGRRDAEPGTDELVDEMGAGAAGAEIQPRSLWTPSTGPTFGSHASLVTACWMSET